MHHFFSQPSVRKNPANNYKTFMMAAKPVIRWLPLEKLEIRAFNNHLKIEFKSKLYAPATVQIYGHIFWNRSS